MSGRGERLALAVADVNWFTTENLFRELDDPDVSLLTLRCMDYVNGRRKGIFPWSPSARLRGEEPARWSRDLVLPPGWMKRFPRLGMRPIARTVRRFWRREGEAARRGLVMTYPHYRYLADQLRPDLSLYYNLDDYALYWPNRADEVRALERELVRSATATVCVSKLRAEELRRDSPEAASRIHHLPHGSPKIFLANEPLRRPGLSPADIAHLPRPWIGYVGTLEDRLDWPLLEALSAEFPKASIVVVGRLPQPSDAPWFKAARRFIDRLNVHVVGWRNQAELPVYYQAFDVNLIPYLVDHPFNRACSPTKIMDGVAATRPMVASAIPECRLYEHLMDVAETREAFVEAVGRILESGSDDGRSEARHDWARANLCGAVVDRLLATLWDPGRSAAPHN